MSEVIAEVITEADRLQQFIDTYTPIVQEARLHFDDAGIHAKAVDPANIAMAFVELDAAAFESYESPGEAVVGVNLGTLDDRLDVANAGDLVHLKLDMETRHLVIEIRNTTQEVALIDPDAIREEPDVPDLDLPNTVVAEAGDIAEAVEVIGMASDHLLWSCDPDAEHVEAIGEGDTDRSVVTFGREELIDASVTDAVESLFSHDYMADIVAPIPTAAEVELRIGDEFPIRLFWNAADGHMDAQQLVAPRIQSD